MKRSRKWDTVEHFRTDVKISVHKNNPKECFGGFVFFHPDYTVGFGISPNLRVYKKYIQARGLIRAFYGYA